MAPTKNTSNRYIVVFKDNVRKSTILKYQKEVVEHGGHILYHYYNVMKGFAAEIPESYLPELQRRTDIIDYIEPDGVANIAEGNMTEY